MVDTQASELQAGEDEDKSRPLQLGEVLNDRNRLEGPKARSQLTAEPTVRSLNTRHVSFVDTANERSLQPTNRPASDNTKRLQDYSAESQPTTPVQTGPSFQSTNRGVSTIEYFREAIPLPFNSLPQDLFSRSAREGLPLAVYGHFKIEDQLIPIELTCMSQTLKYFLLKVKNGHEVHFPLAYSVTAEEFKDLIHEVCKVLYVIKLIFKKFDSHFGFDYGVTEVRLSQEKPQSPEWAAVLYEFASGHSMTVAMHVRIIDTF